MGSLRGGGARVGMLAVAAAAAVAGAGLAAVPAHGQSQTDTTAALVSPAVELSAPGASVGRAAAVLASGPAVPRGGIVYRRGVPVRDVSVSNNGRRVSAMVFWNQRMIARKGNRDRFNVRLVAFGSGGAAHPIMLASRSTVERPSAVQKITIKLDRAKAKTLRASGDVVLAVSQQYGRRGMRGNKYFRQYVTVTKIKAGSKPRVSAGRSAVAASTRAARDCRMIEIKSGGDLSGCDLSRAKLSVCDLTGVNLTGAILAGTILRACDLDNVELAGADLTGVASGGITGTPASLPDGWALVDGVLTATGPTPSPTPAAQVPDAPAAPTSSGVGSGSVTLDWVAPVGNGSAVTGYNVQVDDGTGSNYADAAGCAGLGNVLTCTTTGLANGTGYSFKVLATNSVGNSPYSVAGGPFTPVSCALGGGAAGTCVVGDIGPGGGTVFYANEANPTGSRYLEAAPATWNGGASDPGFEWCNTLNLIAGTFGTAIGTGKANTDNMVASGACASGAANSVRSYGTAGASAGSWSLPSLEELNALDVSGVGGLTPTSYWSSSQDNANNAWYQLVGSGGGSDYQNSNGKIALYNVRPVRAF